MIAGQSIGQLTRDFGIDGVVTFDPGKGYLTRIVVTAQGAVAHIYTLGAHVTHWQLEGHKPVLWLSGNSWFEPGKPIRGGVPVCLPWFNVKPDQPDAPRHGLARTMNWQVVSTRLNDDGSADVALELQSGDNIAAVWPHPFTFRHQITVGRNLTMSLTVRNPGYQPFAFTEALHSYFNVADVRKATVTGLECAPYANTVGGQARKAPGDSHPIAFADETDRIYTGTSATCVLHDPGLDRQITIDKSGSDSTVVWNPWIAKASAMEDFGDDEWPGMLCIETANVADDAVTLAPGTSHTMIAAIRVDR